MKTHETPEMKHFELFLQNVNRINRNGGSGILIDSAEMDELLSANLTETGWNDAFDFENRRMMETLCLAVESIGQKDQEAFCDFLFQMNTVAEIAEKNQHPEDLWNALRGAAYRYSQFVENFAALEYLMKRLESQRNKGTLPRKGRRHTLVGLKRPVFIAITWNEDIEERPEPLFYGFKKFARVKFCKQCRGYFLAKRTDAEYCSESCGSAFRQKLYQSNRGMILQKKRAQYKADREWISANRQAIREMKKKRPNIGSKK